MKAKELMIGDWVYNTHNQQNEQVQEIGSGLVMLNYNDLYEYDEIEPIPLVPEILEKNGFVLESYSGNIMNGKWWTRNDFVIHENMNDSVGRNNFKYEYVHQLQHALRLCGIEKEIIL